MPQPSFVEMLDELPLAPPAGMGSEALTQAVQAVQYIKQMDLPRASQSINATLQLDNRDSYLHFLNGFIYHLQARQGDSQKHELALEGYRMALRLDPGNWIAQEFLGLAYLDLKQFPQAKEQFAQVLLMTPDSGVSAYGLMVAAYLTGDPAMACRMADQLRQQGHASNPVFLRSGVSVFAACGRFSRRKRTRHGAGRRGHHRHPGKPSAAPGASTCSMP